MLTFVGSIFLAGLVALILLLRAPKQICVAVVAGDFRPAVEDLSLAIGPAVIGAIFSENGHYPGLWKRKMTG
jgi:hypothetical protein